MREWKIGLSYPHDWRGDDVLSFDTEEAARKYAEDYPRKGFPGQEGYVRIELYKVMEILN